MSKARKWLIVALTSAMALSIGLAALAVVGSSPAPKTRPVVAKSEAEDGGTDRVGDDAGEDGGTDQAGDDAGSDDAGSDDAKSDAADDGDRSVGGTDADRAKAAALEATGGGTANSVERDGEDGAVWEVEITKTDGSTVDVRLDGRYDVVTIEKDSEGSDAGEK